MGQGRVEGQRQKSPRVVKTEKPTWLLVERMLCWTGTFEHSTFAAQHRAEPESAKHLPEKAKYLLSHLPSLLFTLITSSDLR